MTDLPFIPPENRPPAPRLSRRGFLRIVAGVGIAGLVGKAALDALEALRIISQTRLLMGTLLNLTIIVSDRETAAAEAAIHACLSSMAELEAILSRFQPDSQVSLLNRTGALKDPHPALVELVRQSCGISELSGGLFDITILPVLALYQQYQSETGALPPAAVIEAACHKVDYRMLMEGENKLFFAMPGMGVTLDGIAKGYIVDAGVNRLVEHGFSDVLVEAGGDLVAGQHPRHDQPWKIGIQSPRGAGERLITQINVSNAAVATSGDYMQPFSADYTQHHILNPRTGHSSPALASATVIAPHLAQADALATTLMLMDPTDGLALVKNLGLQALLVTKDQTLLWA